MSTRRWLALFASFCILAIAFSFGLFSLPAFYPVLVKQFGWSHAGAAAGGSIALLLIGTFSPVVGARERPEKGPVFNVGARVGCQTAELSIPQPILSSVEAFPKRPKP